MENIKILTERIKILESENENLKQKLQRLGSENTVESQYDKKYFSEQHNKSSVDFGKMFFESFLPGIMINPKTGIISEINKSAEKMYGYAPGFLKGKPVFMLIKDSEEIVKQRIQNVENERFYAFESSHLTCKGEELNVKIFSGIVNSSDQKFIYFNVLDVTENSQKDSQIKILTLGLEHSPISIFMTDIRGVITYVNKEFYKQTGYREDEAVGKTVEILGSGLNPKEINEGIVESLVAGKIWKGEIINRKKNGDLITHKTSIAPIKTDKETVYFCFQEDISEQKKIQHELTESEEKYHFITDSTPDTIFMIDKNAQILFINDNRKNFVGWNLKSFIGKSVFDLVASESAEFYKSKIAEVFEKKSLEFETIINHISGNRIHVEYNAFTTFKDGKEVAVGSLRNISDRKNNEKKITNLFLESSRTRNLLRSVINSSEDIIYAKDVEGKYLLGGKSFTSHLNLNTETIKGKTNNDLKINIKCQNPGAICIFDFQNDDADVLKSNTIKTYIGTKIEFPDGYFRIFDIKKIPLKKESGEVYALLTIAHDILIRAKAENDLKLLNENLEQKIADKISEMNIAEANFEKLFDQNQDSMFITNKEGTILALNSAALNRLGYTKEELAGNNVSLITTERYKNKRVELIQNLTANKHELFESENITKDGRIFPVEVSSTMLVFNNKEAILSASRDITDRKELQKRILQVIIDTEEQERRRLARELHDSVGADLSGIKMFIDALSENRIPEQKIPKTYDDIRKLILNAVASSREISNNMNPHVLENYGLKEILKTDIEKNNQNSEIFIYCNMDLFNVRLKKEIELNLYRIFKELINNAKKYSGADQIRILIFIKESNLFFSYSDNGRGFDIAEKIENNMGNGLINIRTRVSSMGGNCEFKSRKGEGFNVNISLKI